MKWVYSLKVRLRAASVVASLACVVIGLYGLHAMGRVGEHLAGLGTTTIPAEESLAAVEVNVARLLWRTNQALSGLRAGDRELVQRAQAGRQTVLADLDRAFRRYEALPHTAEQRRAWGEVSEQWKAWVDLNNAAWTAIAAGDAQRASHLDDVPATPPRRKLLAALAQLQGQHAEATRASTGAGAAIVSTTQRGMIALLIAIVVGGVAVGVVLTNSITRPVNKMRDVAEKVARGDVDQTVDHRGEDEIGDLAASFRELILYIKGVANAAESLGDGDLEVKITPRSEADQLSKNMDHAITALRGLVTETGALIAAARRGDLRRRGEPARFHGGYAKLVTGMNEMMDAAAEPVAEAVRTLEKLAERDLTARARTSFEGDYGRMMTALDGAAENLEQSIARVSRTAGAVAGAATQIASSSQSVAEGASQQASALEETSAALVELSATTKRNVESAGRADALAHEASSASSAGATSMGLMMEAMGRIRTAAEGTAAIIRDINEIAFQTNLLALNAAVEAARAGEAGRGFAVVAEEVRALAMRSKEAARKTESLISESMSLTEHGEQVSRDVNGALSQIVDSVGKVTTIVGEITTASDEQATGLDQINRAMSQMDQVTQGAAANAEESSSTAEELAAQAAELANLVSEFRISEEGPARAAPRLPAPPRAARQVELAHAA